jgi:hypothetical protein
MLDERHALYVGWVAGMARAAGLDVGILTDDRLDYTDRILVNLLSHAEPVVHVTVTLVVPPPPPGWEPP